MPKIIIQKNGLSPTEIIYKMGEGEPLLRIYLTVDDYKIIIINDIAESYLSVQKRKLENRYDDYSIVDLVDDDWDISISIDDVNTTFSKVLDDKTIISRKNINVIINKEERKIFELETITRLYSFSITNMLEKDDYGKIEFDEEEKPELV